LPARVLHARVCHAAVRLPCLDKARGLPRHMTRREACGGSCALLRLALSSHMCLSRSCACLRHVPVSVSALWACVATCAFHRLPVTYPQPFGSKGRWRAGFLRLPPASSSPLLASPNSIFLPPPPSPSPPALSLSHACTLFDKGLRMQGDRARPTREQARASSSSSSRGRGRRRRRKQQRASSGIGGEAEQGPVWCRLVLCCHALLPCSPVVCRAI
jgi:hypothetical protein